MKERDALRAELKPQEEALRKKEEEARREERMARVKKWGTAN